MSGSYELAKQHRDVPPTIAEVKEWSGMVSKTCLRYLMGKICLDEKNDNKNAGETVEDIYFRIGREFGYSEPSIYRFETLACFHAAPYPNQRSIPLGDTSKQPWSAV